MILISYLLIYVLEILVWSINHHQQILHLQTNDINKGAEFHRTHKGKVVHRGYIREGIPLCTKCFLFLILSPWVSAKGTHRVVHPEHSEESYDNPLSCHSAQCEKSLTVLHIFIISSFVTCCLQCKRTCYICSNTCDCVFHINCCGISKQMWVWWT